MFPYGKDEQFLQQKSYNSRFDPTFTLRKDEQFLQQKSYNSRLDPTFTLRYQGKVQLFQKIKSLTLYGIAV